jgi:hypothetical protein
MRSTFGIVLGLAALTGCVHRHDLTEVDLRALTDPAPRARVSVPVGRDGLIHTAPGSRVSVPVGHDGLIRMRDGKEIPARTILLQPDTLFWSDAEGGQTVQAPLSRVAELEYRDRVAGTFEGIGLGMLPGVVLMAVAAASVDRDAAGIPGEVAVGVTGAIGAVLGGVLGGLAGSSRGGRTIFRLPVPGTGLQAP